MKPSLLVRYAPAFLLAMLLTLTGCGKDQTPVRIGYLGGLTGRTADLGTAGRNGIQLAVEQVNAAGGIGGRKVELILKDDANDPEIAKKAVRELIAAKVDAITGPMTSNIAVAVAPLVSEAGLLMMAGTVTTNDLTARDDQFFRTLSSSPAHATTMADFLYDRRNVRRVHTAINVSNKAYVDSWSANFDRAFARRGGQVDKVVPYASTPGTDFAALTRQLLEGAPDAVVLITNAVDAALFATQAAGHHKKPLMVTSEWAGTGKLTELGGKNVEGFVVPQYLDPQGTSPEFVAFQDVYRKRFQDEVGYPPVVAFNAAQVVLRALAEQKSGEPLKQTVLRLRRFSGLQAPIDFDDFGDVQSKTYLTEIRDGQYVLLQ